MNLSVTPAGVVTMDAVPFAPGTPLAPDLRVSALSLARAPALELQLGLDLEAAPRGNAVTELPEGLASAVAIAF